MFDVFVILNESYAAELRRVVHELDFVAFELAPKDVHEAVVRMMVFSRLYIMESNPPVVPHQLFVKHQVLCDTELCVISINEEKIEFSLVQELPSQSPVPLVVRRPGDKQAFAGVSRQDIVSRILVVIASTKGAMGYVYAYPNPRIGRAGPRIKSATLVGSYLQEVRDVLL